MVRETEEGAITHTYLEDIERYQFGSTWYQLPEVLPNILAWL